MMYVPDSALVQEEEGESRKNSVSMDNDRALPPSPPNSHLSISTKKVLYTFVHEYLNIITLSELQLTVQRLWSIYFSTFTFFRCWR